MMGYLTERTEDEGIGLFAGIVEPCEARRCSNGKRRGKCLNIGEEQAHSSTTSVSCHLKKNRRRGKETQSMTALMTRAVTRHRQIDRIV